MTTYLLEEVREKMIYRERASVEGLSLRSGVALYWAFVGKKNFFIGAPATNYGTKRKTPQAL
jgi:hypothetical protein